MLSALAAGRISQIGVYYCQLLEMEIVKKKLTSSSKLYMIYKSKCLSQYLANSEYGGLKSYKRTCTPHVVGMKYKVVLGSEDQASGARL